MGNKITLATTKPSCGQRPGMKAMLNQSLQSLWVLPLIVILCLWIFRQADQVDLQKIRESCFIRLQEVCLKMQPHMRRTAGIISEVHCGLLPANSTGLLSFLYCRTKPGTIAQALSIRVSLFFHNLKL
jgi:hypothetical protein